MNERIRVPALFALLALLVTILPASAALAVDSTDGVSGAHMAGDTAGELTTEQKKQIIAALVHSLRTRYVLADKGARVADEIERQATAGAFAAASQPADLARALTEALWEASRDKHLRVMPPGDNPGRRVVRRGGPSDSPGAMSAFGAEMLSGNVGLLTVNRLMPPVEALHGAFRELADAEALIIDVRSCPGGGIGMPAALASYLFEKPQLLLYMESRDGERDPVHTERLPKGAPSFAGKPAYVVTASTTGSACEELSFDLKYHEKALLVGEQTAGAGLGSRSGMADLGHGFEAFIPDMKPVHPKFDGGFEGIGVPPDINVPASDAVAFAHMSALGQLIDRAGDDAHRNALEAELTASALQWTRDVRGRIASSRAFGDFTGRYDAKREIVVDNGGLYYVDGNRGIRGELLEHSHDTFALSRSPGQLLRFERDTAGKVIGFRISEPGGEPWRDVVPRL